MSNADDAKNKEIDLLFAQSNNYPDFVIDGIHFGRGDLYISEDTHLTHNTNNVTSWRIVDEKLEELEDEFKNIFFTEDSYIVQWDSTTNVLDPKTKNTLNIIDNQIYFYWKGENAFKGNSPLPEAIEAENPPVERIVQWAEPPAFLQLFSGRFVVNLGNKSKFTDDPHLYLLRGEEEKELHLYEVGLKRENLRSRTSFVLYFTKEELSVIWHGAKSNELSRKSAKQIAEKVFGNNIIETNEGTDENETFLGVLPNNSKSSAGKVMDYTPKLFYFNAITGSFAATEVERSHKSTKITPLPFLQSHLYTATQPATFLLDDDEIIWIWQGWEYDNQNENFKSECFVRSIDYAKQKSKIKQKLVKVQKVIAGFEPDDFINLFPSWTRRQDIVELQTKDGITPNVNPLIEVISHEKEANKK